MSEQESQDSTSKNDWMSKLIESVTIKVGDVPLSHTQICLTCKKSHTLQAGDEPVPKCECGADLTYPQEMQNQYDVQKSWQERWKELAL
jgi:hypothetical protein